MIFAKHLAKILERENIWCCTFSGSMTIAFAKKSGKKENYFWNFDNGNYSAAHAWIFAPPFKVIDLSLSLQEYRHNEQTYMPKYLIEEKTKETKIRPIDLINPKIVPRRMTMAEALKQIIEKEKTIFTFMNDIQPFKVIGENCSISYFPIRGNASDGELEQLKAISFSGKSALEVYENIIRPKLVQ